MSSWTEAMKEDVRALLETHSASRTADAINKKYGTHFTRNSVIGISHRAGIKGNRSRYKIQKDAPAPRYRRPFIPKDKTKEPFPHATDRSAINSKEWKEKSGCEKTLAQTEKKDCMFPIDTDEGRMYCAREKLEHVSYCEKHAEICYTAPRQLHEDAADYK